MALVVSAERLGIDASHAGSSCDQHRHGLSHLGRGSDPGRLGRSGGKVGRLIRHLDRDLERRRLAQDVRLQSLKRRARSEAELLIQRAARLVVGLESVGLAPGAVERQHQLPPQPLAQWVVADQRLQLAHQLGRSAECEVGLDPILYRVQAQLLEARDLRLCERVVGEIRIGRAPPQLEGLRERSRRGRRVSGLGRRPAVAQQPREATGVELVGLDAQHVPGGAGDQQLARLPLADARARAPYGACERRPGARCPPYRAAPAIAPR